MTHLPLARTVCTTDRSLLYGAVSVLLSVPDSEVLQSVPDITTQVDRIERRTVRRPLIQFLDWLAGSPGAEQHHAHVFDLRESPTLSMTNHLRANPVARADALDALAGLHRAHGLRLPDGEAADHLRVVLDLAALVPDAGEAALRRHQPGLALLHAYLSDIRSPYRLLVDAVLLALPGRDGTPRSRRPRSTSAAAGVRLGPFEIRPTGSWARSHPDGLRSRTTSWQVARRGSAVPPEVPARVAGADATRSARAPQPRRHRANPS